MSDDLISRKTLLKEFREIMDEPHNTMFLMGIGAAVSIIEHRETAFDKEEVIKELQKHSHNYYPSIDHYCTSVKAVKLRDVIDIIEKGR